MARGVNKVILIGNLGNDPEVRYTPGGLATATISLATGGIRKDQQSGEWQEYTEWHRVVFFEKLAETVGQYLRKGSQIYVEGRLQTRKWQDQSGQERYTTEIIANNMQMLGGRGDTAANYAAPPPVSSSEYPPPVKETQTTRPVATPPSRPANTATAPVSSSNPSPSNFDDDVPF